MISNNWLYITLFIFGVVFGSIVGCWTTVGLIISVLILIAAKNSWRKSKLEPEPQPS